MSERLTFPDNFLWGTATAAHQIEGNNTNSDWWRHEQTSGRVAEPSGDATDSWHLYEVDLDIVQQLGLNSYRFSIEWADRKSTRLNSSHIPLSRMPSSA